MTTHDELGNLFMLIRSLGGRCAIDKDSITINGVEGIGSHPMSFIQAAERMREVVSRKAGAAVLGFRGAIRSCRQAGLDEDRVFKLAKDATDD